MAGWRRGRFWMRVSGIFLVSGGLLGREGGGWYFWGCGGVWLVLVLVWIVVWIVVWILIERFARWVGVLL